MRHTWKSRMPGPNHPANFKLVGELAASLPAMWALYVSSEPVLRWWCPYGGPVEVSPPSRRTRAVIFLSFAKCLNRPPAISLLYNKYKFILPSSLLICGKNLKIYSDKKLVYSCRWYRNWVTNLISQSFVSIVHPTQPDIVHWILFTWP
jgi:hypothetical protein